MKKKILLLIAFVLIIGLTGCNSKKDVSSTESEEIIVDRDKVLDDFSFSFVWDVYGISSYDSATGKLVKTSDATHPEDYVTTMFLSDDELIEIYTLLMKINIEDYPSSYDPFNAPNAEKIVYSEPSQTIIIEVHYDTLDVRIACNNIAFMSKGYDKKAQEFVNTYKRIREIITSTDEWKALPEYENFYD